MKRLLVMALWCGLTLQAADVTGTWAGEVQTEAGSGNPTFVFKQDGSKLTGTYKGLLGEAQLTGTVEGEKITFSFTADAQGNSLKIEYSGTIESATQMKGKVQLGEYGSGTWTAKKQ